MAETYVTLSSLKHYDEKIKGVIDEKQDKLVGTDGQVVSFDANGNVISKDLETIDTSSFAKTEDLNQKIDKENPNGTGSLSLNRKTGTSIGNYSIAVGDRTTASGKAALAEGCLTSATAPQSHAEGDGTVASGTGAHAEGGYVDGVYTTASGNYAHAEGVGTTASEAGTHTEGYKTTATAPYAHAEGYETKATGGVAHAEGFKTTAAGLRSHAEGIQSQTGANATAAHAEGWNTQALGVGSHSEGVETVAEGNYAHVEGGNTTAIGKYQHVEGLYNDKVKQILVPGIKWTSDSANLVISMINMSNTLGLSTNHSTDINYTYDSVSYKYKVYCDSSKIDNISTLPTSTSNHYRGYIYFASTDTSDIYDNILLVNEHGSIFIYYNNDEIYNQRTWFGTTVYPSCDIGISEADTGSGVDSYTTPDLTATHVQGKYSYVDKSYAHVVGGGTSDSDRKNIHTLDWDGNAEYLGDVKATKKDGTKVSLVEVASVSNRVKTIEDDYLKSADKTALTTAIATAKQEAIETVLGETVDANFDTLQEIADWIQSDTTASAELVTRVTNAEKDLDSLETSVTNKVDKVNGKGLSTNDFTSTLKSNYDTAYSHSQSAHAPSTAEKNIIVGIQKNGTDLTVNSSTRKVNITVPTKTSELTNDSSFLTAHPTISKNIDSTSSVSPSHGGTFTAVDSITRDTNGHVTKVNTKTVTLPSVSSFMYKNNPTGTGAFSMNGIAGGTNSAAFGDSTVASGRASFVEGNNNKAFDDYSHVEGMYNNKLDSFKSITNATIDATSNDVLTSNFLYNDVSYAKMMRTSYLSNKPALTEKSTTNYYLGKVTDGTTTLSDCLIFYDESTLNVYSNSYSLMNLTSKNVVVTLEKAEIPPSTIATHIQGKYALIDGDYAHVVGNGVSDSERSNAHTLDWEGNATFAGDVKATDASGNTVSLLDVASNSSGGSTGYYVGTCSTSASTASKTSSITGFELKTGVKVYIKFSNTNTSNSSTLNISSTGEKPMYYKDGTRMYYIPSGIYHEFVYDGTNYVYMGSDNAIIGNRSSERYGIKMDGSALVPIVSGYTTSLGTTSSKFGTIYANSLGTDSYPVNNVYGDAIYANGLYTKTGTYRTKILPPLPLIYGQFTVSSYHSITFNSNICERYAKTFYTGSLGTNSDVVSSGCAYPYSAQGHDYDAVFVFRIIGYDSSTNQQAIPFVHEFALSTSYTTYGCGEQSTDWYIYTTPCGNKVYFYISGISISGCGYVSGSPSLNISGTTSNVHFSEIALMP